MSDILGPANAPNAVTDRPSETRTFSNLDSWFKDCTSNEIEDGTDIEAAWLNGIIAALRKTARVNGLLTDGITQVVPEAGNDDFILVKALQQLIQRGQVIYGVDTGSANQLVVALAPAIREYKAGMHILVRPAFSNTGPSNINVNGLGVKNIVRSDGSPSLAGDILASGLHFLAYDGVSFRNPAAIGRPQLVSNLTIYVNAGIGSDANDGTANIAGKAMATIQGAVNRAFSYQPSQFIITIFVADGSYAPVATPVYAGPTIRIVGNIANPQNVIITGNNNSVYVQGPNVMYVDGVHVATGTPPETVSGFVAGPGATLYTDNTSSGFVQGGVFEGFGGTVYPGKHRFSGNSRFLFWAYLSGGNVILARTSVFTITTPIVVDIATAYASVGGVIQLDAPAPTFVSPGNVTGARYSADFNGVIRTLGAGASYFPGTVAGSVTTGGQYA